MDSVSPARGRYRARLVLRLVNSKPDTPASDRSTVYSSVKLLQLLFWAYFRGIKWACFVPEFTLGTLKPEGIGGGGVDRRGLTDGMGSMG